MGADQAQYVLADLIGDLTSVVSECATDSERVAAAEPLVGKLMRDGSWLPADKRIPADTSYARHSLYLDPQDRFEILALVWKPGQRTPVHDHDGTWGVEGVLSGQMQVDNFEQVRELSADTVQLRSTGTLIVNEGGTGQLLPPADCHILYSQGTETTVTIHVYGKQLRQFRVFEPQGQDGLYRVRHYQPKYSA